MSPEELLVAQAEMRCRVRQTKAQVRLLKRRKYKRPEPPPVDLASLPIKEENGIKIIVCPPAYNKDLEFDHRPRRFGSYIEKDDYDMEEERWQPSRSVYKALCNAANGGSYLILDNEPPEYAQTGLNLARELVKVIQKCVKRDRPFPLAWQELLGCDLEYFKEYLEKLFKPGMSWGNWGEWHLDHIKPLVAFSLDFRPELLSACNYRNLQPLWGTDNCSKGGRYEP